MRPNCRQGMELFMKGTQALARMEHNGIRVDLEYLDKALKDAEAEAGAKETAFRKTNLYKRWNRMFGLRTSLESPQQLAKVLKDMGYDTGKVTPTGMMQVDKKSLGSFDLPELREYVEIKEQNKTIATYLKGIRREVDERGILHPFYNLASGDDGKGGAESYRSSSAGPNFQNVPKRNERMKEIIRRCFVSRPGRRLISRDFSGVEVKVAACVTKDPNLVKYVTDQTTDMHRDEACNLFFLRPEQVVKETTRDMAKNMWVFPEFYGLVWFQSAPTIWEEMDKRKVMIGDTPLKKHLAENGIRELGIETRYNPKTKQTEVTKDPQEGTFAYHLRKCENLLWGKRFPAYTAWKKKWYDLYLKRGWFPLDTGFVCRGYYRRNQVLNFRIQGQAYHCMAWSQVEVQKELDRRKMKSLLVGMIHDDLLGDVPDEETQDYLDLTEEVMSERLVRHWDWITVPMGTEVEVTPVGGSWLDGERWVKNAKGVWDVKVKA
jgi:DNA polymerase I